jgi:broad specificity phosphatase PhoE
MSEIYLIRHAQASFGSDNYDRLSPLGVRQADLLARFLSRHKVQFDAVYSGALQRQIDTARPIHASRNGGRPPGSALATLPAFNEYDSLALVKARFRREDVKEEAKARRLADLRNNMRAFQAFFSEIVDQWMTGVFNDEAGVEPWEGFCQRVLGGLAHLRRQEGRGRRLAVVTSGGPIAVMVQKALGLSNQMTAAISWEIYNASITCLKYSRDRLSLTVFNNTTHFLIEGDGSLLTHR